ncbi:tetratricopeptide repeat protein [Ravibacter arvi]
MQPLTSIILFDILDLIEFLEKRNVSTWVMVLIGIIVAVLKFGDFSEALQRSGRAYKNFVGKIKNFVGEKAESSETPAAASEDRTEKLFTLPVIFGLDEEAAEISREIQKSRMVLITGPGGIGKSTLSVFYAVNHREMYPGGAVFIELAPVKEGDRVAQVTAEILRIPDDGTKSVTNQIITFLKAKKFLLIFDNCEHLIAEVKQLIVEIKTNCPHVHVICTSRDYFEVKGLPDGHRLELRSMETGSWNMPTEELRQFNGVKLFEHHARHVNSRFKLSPGTLPSVSKICSWFDGLPLAIILAASRTDILTVEEISEQLDRFLPQLESSSANILTVRHRSMRNAIEWSYELLESLEGNTMMNLSAFADDFSVSAIKKVCFEDSVRVETRESIISKLQRASLLKPSSPKGGTKRFFLLETIRQYSKEKLIARGDAEVIHKRFCEYYLAFVAEHGAHLLGDRQMEKLEILEEQIANIRMAFVYMDRYNWTDMMTRCGAGLWRYWEIRSQLNEGRERLEHIANNSYEPNRDLQEVLNGLGTILYRQADYDQAFAYYQKKLTLDDLLGDVNQKASTYSDLGNVQGKKGKHREAIEYFRKALLITDAGEKSRVNAVIFNNLARESLLIGEVGKARQYYEKSREYFMHLQNKWESGFPLHGLGMAALYEKNYEVARGYFEEALKYREEAKDQRNVAQCLLGLAYVGISLSEMDEARRFLKKSLDINWGSQEEMGLHDTFAVGVVYMVKAGDCPTAIQISAYLQRESRRKANTKLFHVFSENLISECHDEFADNYEQWEQLGQSMSKNRAYNLLNKKLEVGA